MSHKSTRYGQKGGDGPTAGLKARTFYVVLPDGVIRAKRVFHSRTGVVGYAYEHDGEWHIATVDVPDLPQFSRHTQCAAEEASLVPR